LAKLKLMHSSCMAAFKKVKVECGEDMQPASEWTAPTPKAAGASQKSAPDTVGLAGFGAMTQADVDMMVVPEGGVSEMYCDAVVAYLDTNFEKADSATQAADLEKLQGVYWKVGEYNGKPFFKHAEEPVSLWFFEAPAEQGWYFSNHIWSSVAGKAKDTELEIYGWASGDGLPMKVHCPFWAKRAVKNVNLTSLHQFNVMQIETLHASLDQALEYAQGCGAPEQAVPATPENDDDDDVHGDKGFAQRGPGGEVVRGGWLPRVSNLVAAVWSKDWEVVERYCLEYYKNGTCKWMVNKYLARLMKEKSSSSKGGGKCSKSHKPVGGFQGVWRGGSQKWDKRPW
jgi:hypothetical protein